jgi:nucleoside-diphosphate-sugar epimerase
VARALIVGCGCRGRGLGERLRADGWSVRGTSRSAAGIAAIEAAGIEAAEADPDRLGTVLDLIGDVTVVVWLMGSASGTPEEVAAVNGDRLESLTIRLVDTPVRGLVYEGAGSAPDAELARGRALVEDASQRWQIPVAVIEADPGDPRGWVEAAAQAVARATG